jgi:hypothetical protein
VSVVSVLQGLLLFTLGFVVGLVIAGWRMRAEQRKKAAQPESELPAVLADNLNNLLVLYPMMEAKDREEALRLPGVTRALQACFMAYEDNHAIRASVLDLCTLQEEKQCPS